MKDWDLNEIQQALEELQRLGFVEVVGIKPDGEWLYGATELGVQFVQDGDNIFEKMKDLVDNSEVIDKEEDV
jgi:hypothetical protein